MFTVANIGMRKWSRELTMAEILQIAQPQLSEYIGPGGRWTGCRGVSAALHIGDTREVLMGEGNPQPPLC